MPPVTGIFPQDRRGGFSAPGHRGTLNCPCHHEVPFHRLMSNLKLIILTIPLLALLSLLDVRALTADNEAL